MQQSTAQKLIALTNHFYETVAVSFGATRQHPWAGFDQLAPFFTTQPDLNVLDVGCGNGRLADVLKTHGSTFLYTGIDVNAALLAETKLRLEKATLANQFTILQDNFLQHLLEGKAAFTYIEKFSHVCAFGVFHHIPLVSMRTQLLREMVAATKSKGYVMLSFWQPLNQPARFANKTKNPADHAISADELLPNDLLLGWQDQEDVVRYCHSFTDAEIDALVAEVKNQAKLVTKFQTDGKTNDLNQYIVLQKIA